MGQDRGYEEANDKTTFWSEILGSRSAKPEYPDMRLILSTGCQKSDYGGYNNVAKFSFKKKLDLGFLGYVGTVSDD
jgi:hypothetical protein